jgi:hypothetical protein
MDDFTNATLHESRNEYTGRLISILTPLIMEGYNSIFDEAWNLCKENDETEKYLMTFQNLISRVPKWSNEIVSKEKDRIIEKSGCNYLEDLLTCVHIIQLKLLTTIRVGKKQKKIEIEIPKIEDFIHKSYIHVARKIYTNVYLYEKFVTPLQKQKYNREIELIIQDCTMNAIRETLPIESVLKSYMDESIEEDYIETIKQEKIPVKEEEDEEEKEEINNENKKIEDKEVNNDSSNLEKNKSNISFNDEDVTFDNDNKKQVISAPKTIERLEEISNLRNEQRKIEEEDDDDDNNFKLNIQDQDINIETLSFDKDKSENIQLNDIEILE